MQSPPYDGHLILDRMESDSTIHLESMDERRKSVEGIVKIIRLSASIGKAGGHWSEGYGITLSWSMARDCYLVGMPAGTIHFASTAVEAAINNDIRMKQVRQEKIEKLKKRFPETDGWLYLDRDTLKAAKDNDLPSEILLGEGESIDNGKVQFLERRNKIAHGDYRMFSLEMDGDYGLDKRVASDVVNVDYQSALDQFMKASSFLKSWLDQRPKVNGFFRYAKRN